MIVASFWEAFLLLLIFLPLALLWGFALVDLFRRDDITWARKAVWIAGIIVFPIVGTLAYAVVRPPGATRGERLAAEAGAQTGRRYPTEARTDNLYALADLHDRGKINDDEYRMGKARIIDTIDSRPVIV